MELLGQEPRQDPLFPFLLLAVTKLMWSFQVHILTDWPFHAPPNFVVPACLNSMVACFSQ